MSPALCEKRILEIFGDSQHNIGTIRIVQDDDRAASMTGQCALGVMKAVVKGSVQVLTLATVLVETIVGLSL